MTSKYKNKYRIASARAEWWDYRANAAYFITICTQNRKHYFGQIKQGKMNLSQVGVLADAFWHEIKNHSKHVELDAFVVMPNHIHGILILDNYELDLKLESESADLSPDIDFAANPDISDIPPIVQTRHALSLPPPPHPRFQNQGKNSVSSIIGSYKSAITKHCNRMGFEFGWQPRFHDHIIRNDQEFDRIATYIENNISKWDEDKFYR